MKPNSVRSLAFWLLLAALAIHWVIDVAPRLINVFNDLLHPLALIVGLGVVVRLVWHYTRRY